MSELVKYNFFFEVTCFGGKNDRLSSDREKEKSK